MGLLSWSLWCASAPADSPPAAGDLVLHLRTRVQPFKGSDAWEEVVLRKALPARETAILICDMWDDHWCKAAAARCAVMAKRMDPVLQAARARGVLVIHAPSECMDFYKETSQRRRIAEAPRVKPPKPLDLTDPPLPVDASTGGCDDENPGQSRRAWTRQHPAITIAEDDVISDNGAEIYSFLQRRGVRNLIIMGVHTNMCVLGRSFGIRQMSKWGIRCVLVRDLTDAMYDPRKAPYVSHEAGTELVIQHIEKYWCPSILSADLSKGPEGGSR